eukprot:gene33015-40746_t
MPASRDAVNCPAGSAPEKVIAEPVSGVLSCPAGSAPVDVTVTATAPVVSGDLTCPAGSAPVDGVCTFCAVGTYALAAAKTCTKCPKGFSSPPNSVSPDACAPHSHKKVKTSSCAAGSAPVAQANGSKLCTFCPIGSYALAGDESCTQCPFGFSSPVNSVSKAACYSTNLRA